MWWVIGLVLVLAALELGIWIAVKVLKKRFQWLITPADITPKIDPDLIDKYCSTSFDPELGWTRKPGTSGEDRTLSDTASYAIDDRGSRRNPGFEGRPATIAVFGDSFAFCRLVNDDETWPHYLARALDENVLNFGVGNYGLDQACLRMERDLPGLDCRMVIRCVVPETMARIQSYWKHYFEFGNVLAFKPRFTLEGDGLVLHKSAVRTADDFRTYEKRAVDIQRLDHFFERKFLNDVLRFPHIVAVVRRGRRHIPILWYLVCGLLTGRFESGRRRAFSVVLRENQRATMRLYADDRARALFAALVRRFAQHVRRAGAEPLLLILPQPIDLDQRDRDQSSYGPLLAELESEIAVVDMTDRFHAHPNRDRLFVDGPLGPHVSPAGNQIIADAIAAASQRVAPREHQAPITAYPPRSQAGGR